MPNIKVGFVGFGEVNTPREIIERKCLQAIDWLHSAGFDIVSTAPVSDDPGGEEVRRAIAELSRAEFDLLIVCVAGWIPSPAVIRESHPLPARQPGRSLSLASRQRRGSHSQTLGGSRLDPAGPAVAGP